MSRWRLAALVIAVGVVAVACSPGGPAQPTITLPAPTSTPPVGTAPTGPEDLPGLVDDLDGVVVQPTDDLVAMVDGADPGTTFLLAPGKHRIEEPIVPKAGMAFVGLGEAHIDGSEPLGGFRQTADGLWRLDGITRSDVNHGDCIEGYDACGFPEDLFVDDIMLWQVTSPDELARGRWMWDDGGLVMFDDPTSRRVELSRTTFAFVGDAPEVTIRDLVVEKFATMAQNGAIQAQLPGDGPYGKGWLIENVEVTGSHGAGIRTGDGTVVRGSYLHRNGQLGITVSGGTDVLIEDNEIAFNNIAGFDWGWEGGGAKFTQTLGLVVRGNWSHDNDGPGLWTDIDARNTLYEDNLVEGNSAPGIFHEISYAAVIRNNTVTGNGVGKDEWLWGAGILVAASSDVEVYGNIVTDNGDGIAGIQQDRGEGAFGPYEIRNLWVHDNTVTMTRGQTGIVEDTGDRRVFTEWNNRFDRNTYLDLGGRRFAWRGRSLDFAGWQAEGLDLDGRMG